MTVAVCILPALSYSVTLPLEWESRATPYWIARTGTAPYVVSKMIAGATAGALTLAIGMGLFIGIFSGIGYPFYTVPVTGAPSEALLAEGRIAAGFGSYVLNYGLSGALAACCGTLVATFIPDAFVAASSPLLLYFTLTRLTSGRNLQGIQNPLYWMQGMVPAPTAGQALLEKLAMVTVLCAGMTVAAVWQMKRSHVSLCENQSIEACHQPEDLCAAGGNAGIPLLQLCASGKHRPALWGIGDAVGLSILHVESSDARHIWGAVYPAVLRRALSGCLLAVRHCAHRPAHVYRRADAVYRGGGLSLYGEYAVDVAAVHPAGDGVEPGLGDAAEHAGAGGGQCAGAGGGVAVHRSQRGAGDAGDAGEGDGDGLRVHVACDSLPGDGDELLQRGGEEDERDRSGGCAGGALLFFRVLGGDDHRDMAGVHLAGVVDADGGVGLDGQRIVADAGVRRDSAVGGDSSAGSRMHRQILPARSEMREGGEGYGEVGGGSEKCGEGI